VTRFRGWLIAQGHATEEELAAADERGAESAEKAWEFARESPYPDEKELLTDVFAPPARV
jgi:pyruvate dehydrogenase E1 component alpha subunit